MTPPARTLLNNAIVHVAHHTVSNAPDRDPASTALRASSRADTAMQALQARRTRTHTHEAYTAPTR